MLYPLMAYFRDVTNLGNTGYFSEVNPVFTTVPEGVKLDFAVTVNPITTGVSFEGNTVYTSEVLTKLWIYNQVKFLTPYM